MSTIGSIAHDTVTSTDKTVSFNYHRGLIAQLEPGIIKNAKNSEIWNCQAYEFLHEPCPESVNANLWKMGQRTFHNGLFEVLPGLYQVRGFDLSNITFIEGEKGIIVVDPLISVECAQAALKLYYSQRGFKEVTGLMYTHSHTDHFGGAAGIVGIDTDVPIVAPEGFMKEAVDENLLAGPAMLRRARYMYGTSLPRSAAGNVGIGLGMATSTGTRSLIPPNMYIGKTGERRIIDGVEFVFQMVSGTEAPSEFNFYLPNLKALCVAECATQTMHNITTLRGAEVRDAKAWAQCLDETLSLHGFNSDVLFASHQWPTWGQDEIVRFLTDQRDLYAYMHDQTVRLMNEGMNGIEIAEYLTLPISLQSKDYVQGYYGSLSHNVKGIYQKYMTWFDGNPANLWKYPAREEGQKYVDCMGGIDSIMKNAQKYTDQGDLRFASTLLSHVVAGFPEHTDSKLALAEVFTKLGYGCENATWRNFYLTGALDLKATQQRQPRRKGLDPLLQFLPVEKWMEVLCTMIDGTRAQKDEFVIDIRVLDEPSSWKIMLSNSALTCRRMETNRAQRPVALLNLSVKKEDLWHILRGDRGLENDSYDGDVETLRRLLNLVR